MGRRQVCLDPGWVVQARLDMVDERVSGPEGVGLQAVEGDCLRQQVVERHAEEVVKTT